MNTLPNTVEKLIEKLRDAKPVLNDPENVTGRIMQQIEHTPVQLKPRYLIWFRIASSSAAVFFLGLLLLQQTTDTTVASVPNQTFGIERQVTMDSISQRHRYCESSNMIKSYFCYLQEHSIKNNQLKALKQL